MPWLLKAFENFEPMKILKACSSNWLTDGDNILPHVISHFKQLVVGLDTSFTSAKTKKQKELRKNF